MPLPRQVAATDHRPWPLPQRPWVMWMRWLDLAFLHWPVDARVLERELPRGLELDTFEGTAWLGVVPFRMEDVRPRWVPSIPGISAFPEINLRTYVTAEGKPGVWFFSLDVTSRLAVRAARMGFHLPYFKARMDFAREGETVHYASARIDGGVPYGFEGSYRPTAGVELTQPGSFEAWLTERYCLYSANKRGQVFRGEVHHLPWPLQRGEAEIRKNTLAEGLGIELIPECPHVHIARELDVAAWMLERVGGGGQVTGPPGP